jgi:hypothetical protein
MSSIMLTQAGGDTLLPAIARIQREQVELEARLQQRIRELEHEASMLRRRMARLSGLE